MPKQFQLKKWALIGALSLTFGLAAVSTSVFAANNEITVKADTVTVRMGPGLTYAAMGEVKQGTALDVIGHRNAWYKVRLASNQIGWVPSWLIDHNDASTTSAKIATVTKQASIYAYADAKSQVIGTLESGATANVIYQDGDWSQLNYNHQAVWVKSNALKVSDQTVTLTPATQIAIKADPKPKNAILVTTRIDTNVREAAGMNAKVITQVKKGTKLTVLSQSNDWYRVQTADDKVGYVASWTADTPNSAKAKAATKLSEATIVLDPGHGGTDVGALSQSGKYEKTYTLATAQRIAAKLKAAGANVIFTRSTDTFVDLAPRPIKAAKAHADAFISIHFDSSPEANSATGFTTYYYDNSKDYQLASDLSASLKGLPLDDRGVAFGNFEVLRENTQPSVLLEMGYINNSKDFKSISSPQYQEEVADRVAKGLSNYFKDK
ncbi:N-acetylmuramoyl-L-alanine amidase [Lacticaseibacillus saniviri]